MLCSRCLYEIGECCDSPDPALCEDCFIGETIKPNPFPVRPLNPVLEEAPQS